MISVWGRRKQEDSTELIGLPGKFRVTEKFA